MAYATVASLSQQTKSSGTSHTMNYPATVAADELLLLVVEMGANNAPTISAFTSVFDEATVFGNYRHACFARKADASEGGGTFTITFASSTAIVVHLFRIQSWGGTIASHILSARTTFANAPYDPPNLSFGSSDDWLVIAGGGQGGSSGITAVSYPSGYSNGAFDNANSVFLNTSRKDVTGSSENPGTYSTTGGGGSGATFTVAVAPGSSGGGGGGPVIPVFMSRWRRMAL